MYQNFIGIDISKASFEVALYNSKISHSFNNDLAGFESFKKAYDAYLKNALVVLETTGGYELEQVGYLQLNNIAVHRANTRKVKHFIKSFGILGKSDSIDAKALAHYGFERHPKLEIYKENPQKKLQKLVERREDLKKILVQEKNRLQAPDQKGLAKSFKRIIKVLQIELTNIENEIEEYCKKHSHFNAHRKVLESVSGIGKVVSVQILALIPEIGTLDRRKIASLAGLAPHPYESGNKKGYRCTRGGRESVKKVLFMAALTASRSQCRLGEFYQNLVNSGKKKMVAIVALMRKILIVANARLREFIQLHSLNQHG